jgi:hypothetical protein
MQERNSQVHPFNCKPSVSSRQFPVSNRQCVALFISNIPEDSPAAAEDILPAAAVVRVGGLLAYCQSQFEIHGVNDISLIVDA